MPDKLNSTDQFLSFDLGFTARQDYFTHLEPSQSVGEAKCEIPEKKTPIHSEGNLACLTCDPSYARTQSGEI